MTNTLTYPIMTKYRNFSHSRGEGRCRVKRYLLQKIECAPRPPAAPNTLPPTPQRARVQGANTI